MKKPGLSSNRTNGAASRIARDPASAKSQSKSAAASALAQRSDEASANSRRVIKHVSEEHHDALRRLADR